MAYQKNRVRRHTPLLIQQRECPKGPARWYMRKIRVRRLEDIDTTSSAGDRHVLFSVVLPGDRLADDARGCLESPYDGASIGVDGDKLTSQFASEDETTRGNERTCPIGTLEWNRPFRLPSQWINRAQMSAHAVRIKYRGNLDGAMRIAGFEIFNLIDRIRLVLHAVIGRVDIGSVSTG